MHRLSKILLSMWLVSGVAQAQTLEGLWTVQQVTVGEEVVTPVAKWFFFEEDGVMTGGNGETRNAAGLYEYDFDAGTLQMYDAAGNADPYGAFEVAQTGWGTLELRREEEGNAVLVILEGANAIPKAPWDLLVGMWQQNAASELLPDRIFFRWDREYRGFQEGDFVASGIWHVNAHFPELRMLSNAGDAEDTKWMISFSEDGNTLTLEGEGYKITYTRQAVD